MTDSGEKPEEYREITPYWAKRLLNNHCGWHSDGSLRDGLLEYKSFGAVFARNGYNPKRDPSWLRKWESTSIGYGREKWGAEPGKKYFVIKLGERIDQ